LSKTHSACAIHRHILDKSASLNQIRSSPLLFCLIERGDIGQRGFGDCFEPCRSIASKFHPIIINTDITKDTVGPAALYGVLLPSHCCAK
jgi:hypothetical protein